MTSVIREGGIGRRREDRNTLDDDDPQRIDTRIFSVRGRTLRVYRHSVNIAGIQSLLRRHRPQLKMTRSRTKIVEIMIPEEQLGNFDAESVDRSEGRGTRVDFKISRKILEALEQLSPQLRSDLEDLEVVACQDFRLPPDSPRSVHLFYVCPGDQGQVFHIDHHARSRKYVTLVIPLAAADGSGGTEFESPRTNYANLLKVVPSSEALVRLTDAPSTGALQTFRHSAEFSCSSPSSRLQI